jgi:phage-related tail protein
MPPKKPTSTKKPVKKPAAKKPTAKKTTTKKVADTTKKISDGVAKAEAAVDNAVNTATAKVKKTIGTKHTNKVADFAHKADELAGKASDFADQADTFAQDVLPASTGSDVEITAEWDEKISRLFIFRFLRLIIEYWVFVVRGLWMAVI